MNVNWDKIDALAKAHRLTSPTADAESLRRELSLWWSIQYGRPLKDPLLASYTLDELIYEYLVHYYLKNDPKKKEEEIKVKESDDEWIKEQLKQMQAKKSGNPPEVPSPPEISTRFD